MVFFYNTVGNVKIKLNSGKCQDKINYHRNSQFHSHLMRNSEYLQFYLEKNPHPKTERDLFSRRDTILEKSLICTQYL